MSLADWEITKEPHRWPGYLRHTCCGGGYPEIYNGVWKCRDCGELTPIEMLQVATLMGAKDNSRKRIHYGT